jgi:hypothetical protein
MLISSSPLGSILSIRLPCRTTSDSTSPVEQGVEVRVVFEEMEEKKALPGRSRHPR